MHVAQSFSPEAAAPWEQFPSLLVEDSTPSYILLRPNTDEGQNVSNRMYAATQALQVCQSFVDAYTRGAENGGTVDSSALDEAYKAAQEVLRMLYATTDELPRTGDRPEAPEPAQSCRPPKSPYADRIRAMEPGYDPRHIEAYMRLQYATLDHLDQATFAHEVDLAVACIQEGGVEMAERNAQSFGF